MKKSHRKDVIIARIIFAVLCLLLIVLIAVVITLFKGRAADHAEGTQTSQVTSQLPPVTDNPDLPPVTENPVETESEDTYVWTSDGVNLRAEPNTDCEVLAVLGSGTQLTLLGEEDGWVQVSFNGQEGYISTDYITSIDPFEEEAQ
jgi:uncharacterized protein YgiM (DUF1202 family)